MAGALKVKTSTGPDVWTVAAVNPVISSGGVVDSVNGETGVVVLNQDEVLDGTTYKQYSQTEKTKLAGVATGATANSTDAQLRDRSTHTGTQSADTVVDGTTNHVFTAADDTKLAGIATGATVGPTQEQIEDWAAALFAAGTHTNATVTYNDATPSLSIAATSGAPSDTVYGSSWNGVTTIAPSKNTVWDAIGDTDGLSVIDYVTLLWGDAVQLAGAQTITGAKTFSADPLIPDESYSSSWNGVLEPPTKNAVYDEMETKVASTTINTMWTGSQASYDGLGSYDSATLYVIV